MMKNSILFSVIAVVLLIAVAIGIIRNRDRDADASVAPTAQSAPSVPSEGQVQVLNGCGAADAGKKMAAFLRAKNFDVKIIGSDTKWNYPYTIVVARTRDMTVARQIATALKTDHCVLIRNGDTTYNVTVIIGPDFEERTREEKN